MNDKNAVLARPRLSKDLNMSEGDTNQQRIKVMKTLQQMH
jgi:hypothetical protein